MEILNCAFSGHREIPAGAAEGLRRALSARIDELAEAGCRRFLCGGALGFDTLAAEAVLEVRERRPAVRLVLALPCPGQDRRWAERDRAVFARILAAADETVLVSPAYHRYCMMQRNRYLVDHSDLLICYLTRDRGGTAYTVGYALRRGVAVENLAAQIEPEIERIGGNGNV